MVVVSLVVHARVISALVVFARLRQGEKTRDELTGNRAVKQYHQSTKNGRKEHRPADGKTQKHLRRKAGKRCEMMEGEKGIKKRRLFFDEIGGNGRRVFGPIEGEHRVG